MKAFYNEFNPEKAAWLRELIKQGVITDGEVDERDIREVEPADVMGFDRVHLFSGLGAWDHALNLAGWGTERVWTISCPCPPFSVAGKEKECPECGARGSKHLIAHVGRTGCFVCCVCQHEWLADERHLWPEVWRLRRGSRPCVTFGEQVWSEGGRTWFASVRASMEILGYACRGYGLCSPAAGGSDIRRRLYFSAEWLADANGRESGNGELQPGGEYGQLAQDGGLDDGMADAEHPRYGRPEGVAAVTDRDEPPERVSDGDSASGRLDHAEHGRPTDKEQGAELGQTGRDDRVENAQRDGRRGWCDGDTPGDGWQIQAEGRVPSSGMGDANNAQGPRFGEHGRSVLPVTEPERSAHSDALRTFWPDTVWIPCNDPGGPTLRPVQALPESIYEPLFNAPPGDMGSLCNVGSEAERELIQELWKRYGQSLAELLGIVRITCSDGTERTVIWPLIENGKNRRLRIGGYGDAINPELAAMFIESYVETRQCIV